jgi:protein phosphatase
MKIVIPELSLVLLVGASGAGKSTFARKHFRPTEILSSDFFRGMVCDDEANQAVSRDAFELLHLAVNKRLAWRKLTVVDATNLQPDRRKEFLALARRCHYLSLAIVFDLPEALCQANNLRRPERTVGNHVVSSHRQKLEQSLKSLPGEGFHQLYTLRSREEVEQVLVERVPMNFDRAGVRGPFDLIGDVHGCFDELVILLEQLGYRLAVQPDEHGIPTVLVTPPPGRKAVFVGDLVDRGPNIPGVLRLVMNMVGQGHALCVLGNHDNKLLRKLRGHDVQIAHGLAESLRQLKAEPREFKEQVVEFLAGLPYHYLLDKGRLVVAHAGLRQDLQGRISARVRSFALFGDTTGDRDEHGLPIRRNWAAEYRGYATVVYGHTPVTEAVWLNRTMNLDTGCVFGGQLSALRYPEKELVSVPAAATYCPCPRPFQNPTDLPVTPDPAR